MRYFLCLFVFLTTLAFSQNTLTVIGTANAALPLAKERISFTLAVNGPTALEAEKEEARVLAQIQTGLVSLGLKAEDLMSYSYVLQPAAEAQHPKAEGGFTVTAKYFFFHSLWSKKAALLELLAKARVEKVDGVQKVVMYSRDEVEKAFMAAYDDAFLKASALAKKTGISLGKVLSMAEVSPLYDSAAFSMEGRELPDGSVLLTYPDAALSDAGTRRGFVEVQVTFRLNND